MNKGKHACCRGSFGWRVSAFLGILYVLCFAWYWIHPVNQAFHLQSLQLAFFGFTGMNFWSFVFGLIQVFVWAWILVGIKCLLTGGCSHGKSECCSEGKDGSDGDDNHCCSK